MKKRRFAVIAFSILCISLLNLVSGGVYYSQLEGIYNLGDMISLEITVDPVSPEYLLEVSLMCDENEVIEFNNYPDENGVVNIRFPLNFYTIREASGECYFTAEYDEDKDIRSRKFEISKRLDVRLDTDSLFAKPGEGITVSGTVSRVTGLGINGEVEVRVPLLSLAVSEESEQEIEDTEEVSEEEVVEEVEEASEEEVVEEVVEEEVVEEESVSPGVDNGVFYGKVVDGAFSLSFSLDEDTPAGDYRIDVTAFEKSNGKRTSEGGAMANLKIFQVLTSVDVALSDQNFDPGAEVSFKPMLMDQSGLPMYDEVSIIIRDDSSERIFEQIANSQDTIYYKIPSNLTGGYHEIEVSSGDINVVKKFYINEKEIASFRLENETLMVTNIGNIPYKKDIQIDLNGKPFVKKLDLELGEKQSFRLTGSNEEYDIKISDGETEISQGGILLTGHAVGVKHITEGMPFSLSPWVWIFIVIILLGAALYLARNVFKKKSFAYPFKGKFSFRKKSKTIKLDENGNLVKESGPVKASRLESPNQAEQVLVLKGQKSKIALVVLKIKNKISKVSKGSLEKAIEQVYDKKGAVYEQGDYLIILFSPLVTRSFKNEVEAAKVAERIVLLLKEHNKKFKDKIDFGVAINSGEIINRIEDKKLKFTPLGNLITATKRLAGVSDKQVLVTKEAYESGISDIRAEKKKVNDGEVYELKKIQDNERNQQFIQNFLARQKEEKK